MPKVISVTLGNIDDIVEELEKYKSTLTEKAAQLREAVGEFVRDEAQTNFNNAQYNDGHGTPQVTVTVRNSGEITTVDASGEEVAFIELGAGVHYNNPDPAGEHPLRKNYPIGSYGKGFGKRQAWGYYDGSDLIVTHGTPAQMPMYNAMLQVEPNIADITGEIFK